MSTKKKIAGVAMIVVALALLLGNAMNFTTAVHDAADAQPTSVIKQQESSGWGASGGKQTIVDLGDGTILFLPEHQ